MASPPAPQPPYVEFHFEWNQGVPWTSYTIAVEQSGATHFHGIGNSAEAADGDAFDQQFALSEADRLKVFELAKAANYFHGDFDLKQKNIAKTGLKTLMYRGEGAEGSTTFNYSRNADIQQLTTFFQSVATTVDYGRKLEYQYRYDKLGMDARLNELSDLQKSGFADGLQAIEPILRKIADDPSVMHIARQQAKALLKSIGAAVQQPAQP